MIPIPKSTLTFLLTVGFLFGNISIAGAQDSRLVSVGDHKLEVRVEGQGEPTVVFESGLGHDLQVWEQVADEIKLSARVVSYSRAGYGQSESGTQPRTLQQIATEFDALLQTLSIDEPVILVGHSAGGIYIRQYAERHPEKVKGLVFVDPTPEKILVRLRDIDRERALDEEATIASMTPDRVKPEDTYFSQITKSGEYPAVGQLPDVPAALITAMKQEYPQFLLHSVEGKEIWRDLQSDLIDQFSDRLHIVSSASGHDVHRQHPQLVINAINYVMRQTAESQADD